MSSSKSKQKGTGGEREVIELARSLGRQVRRQPASSRWDVDVDGEGDIIDVLATRPDRGRWLASIELSVLLSLLSRAGAEPPLHIEVKRHRKFAHHTIYEGKFSDGGVGR